MFEILLVLTTLPDDGCVMKCHNKPHNSQLIVSLCMFTLLKWIVFVVWNEFRAECLNSLSNMVERPPGNHLNFPIQIHFEVFFSTDYFESFECYYKFNSHFRFQKELTIQHLDFELFPSNIIFIYSASKMREHTIQLLNVLSLVYKLANCNFQWHERHPINVLNWTEAKKIYQRTFIYPS